MTPTRLTLVMGSMGAMKRALSIAVRYAYVTCTLVFSFTLLLFLLNSAGLLRILVCYI